MTPNELTAVNSFGVIRAWGVLSEFADYFWADIHLVKNRENNANNVAVSTTVV